MTERKPPGTSWETWIETRIRVAMEKGAFDNLCRGPVSLSRISEYDPLWWVAARPARGDLYLPPSLELLRKVQNELAMIEKLHDEASVRRRVAALNGRDRQPTVMDGPPTRLGTLDVD